MPRRFSAILGAVESIATYGGLLALMTLMLTISADVVMRYVFNSPFSWVYDITTIYVMVGLFYLGLAPSFAAHAHINVDLLHHFLSPDARRACLAFVNVVACAFFAELALVCAGRAIHEFETSAYSGDWPVAPASTVASFGAALLALRLALEAIRHLAALGRRDTADLPPLAGAEAGERTAE